MSKGLKSYRDHGIEFLKQNRQFIIYKCITADGTHICSHADEDKLHCAAYAYPNLKWKDGNCPLSDEQLRIDTESQTK